MSIKTSYVLLLLALPAISNCQTVQPDPEMYACRGISFADEDALPQEVGYAARAPHALTSPNGKNRVEMIRPKVFAVFVNGRRMRTLKFPRINAGIELGWSPDSIQFFIMYSAGGAIGDFHVHAFTIHRGHAKELVYPRVAANDFHRKHSCTTRFNNLRFLGWTPDSVNAFVVAEVYPTGDCNQAGLFRGYLMDTRTGAVVRRFGEQDTEQIKKSCRVSGTVKVNLNVRR